MTGDLEVDFADEADIPGLLVLAERAWAEAPLYGGQGRPPDCDRWEDVITAVVAHGCPVVGRVGGVLAGAILGCREQDYGTGDTAVVDLLTYIAPEHRSEPGLLAAMAGLMEAWGEEHGLHWARLGSRSGYRPKATARLFASLGYRPMPFVESWKRLH